jgi:hypothetical protein
LGAETAVKAAPQVLSVLQDLVLGSELSIADHFSWEMFVNEGADGRTRATVEALEGRIDPEATQFFSELRVNESHVSSFSEGDNRGTYSSDLTSS